jgi:acetyltransferase-like isoleucine patch superfamily enzyme
VVKRLLSLFAVMMVAPLVISWRTYHSWTGRESLFVTFSQLLSLIPGKVGVYLRRGYYRMTLVDCADDVCVGFGTYFSHPTVRIAEGVYIGSGCTIGMVDIGKRVMIGSNVDILSGRHQHARDSQNQLSDSQEGTFECVRIGEHSWIGNSSVVMATVGNGCTVGAGSVVVKDIPDGQTVAGNPAKVIGTQTAPDRSQSREQHGT